MRITCLVLLLSAIFFNLNAQSTQEEVDLIQSVFGMEKKALVKEFVRPNAAEQDAFWKLYDEYETARKALGKKRIELLEKYSENFASLSNELAADLLKESLALTKENDKLVASYVKKLGKATNPALAMQFHQIEMYILSEIRVAIASNLPFPEVKQ